MVGELHDPVYILLCRGWAIGILARMEVGLGSDPGERLVPAIEWSSLEV